MKIDIKNIKKIKDIILNIIAFVIHYIFLNCFVIFILILILGGILYYKYIILTQRVEKIDFRPNFLKEEFHQRVLDVWQKDRERFQDADLRNYSDPFNKKPSDLTE